MARLERLVLDEGGKFVGADWRDAATYNRRVEVEPVGRVVLASFPKKELRRIEGDIGGWEGVAEAYLPPYLPPEIYGQKPISQHWGFEVGKPVIRGVLRREVCVPIKFYIITGFYYESGHFESLLE